MAFFYAYQSWGVSRAGFGGDTAFFASRALTIISGALGGVAAWEAGRLRVGRIWALAPGRDRYRIAFECLRPVVLLVVVTDLVVLLALSVHFSATPRLDDLPVLLLLLIVQAAAIVVGFGAGSSLPRALAAPVVTISITLWLMIPATLVTPWVRYLNGLLTDGSSVVDTLAPHAIGAPMLLATAVICAVLLASAPLRSRLVRTALAACCLVAGALPAHAMVADAGYETPTVPRAGTQTCAEGKPRICVPSELADTLPRLRAAADTAIPNLAAAGVKPPRTLAYVSHQARVAPNTWRMHVERPMTDRRALRVVATALVPIRRYDACPSLPDDYPMPSSSPVSAWLSLAAGMPRRDVASAHSGAVLEWVEEVRAKDRATQLRWVDTQLRALRSCDPHVHEEARR
ncbi:hypothetical protein GL263_15510 [Streptomyces durbertensis]|uniref:DUF7224 domain-containing protein n=1 Tax=Streptomyces durbertensis TaxID=2448886 RepID=A0ABR6EIH6_9ACTN|nr:hypothetical protein [Streptomyces durbertensis]MBB1244963.1 hypothetical protein [Streptomyces durbertensis]